MEANRSANPELKHCPNIHFEQNLMKSLGCRELQINIMNPDCNTYNGDGFDMKVSFFCADLPGSSEEKGRKTRSQNCGNH